MGGCVSSPKDLDLNEGDAPVESPVTPNDAEGETVAQENTEAVAEEKEEPLVDLSEPTEEAKPEEAEAATETIEVEAQVEETNEEPLVTL